jgi:hypothetical protein
MQYATYCLHKHARELCESAQQWDLLTDHGTRQHKYLYVLNATTDRWNSKLCSTHGCQLPKISRADLDFRYKFSRKILNATFSSYLQLLGRKRGVYPRICSESTTHLTCLAVLFNITNPCQSTLVICFVCPYARIRTFRVDNKRFARHSEIGSNVWRDNNQIRQMWISEQTTVTSARSIKWLVFIVEMECLLRGTDWVFKCNPGFSSVKGLWMYALHQLFQTHVLNVSRCVVQPCFNSR